MEFDFASMAVQLTCALAMIASAKVRPTIDVPAMLQRIGAVAKLFLEQPAIRLSSNGKPIDEPRFKEELEALSSLLAAKPDTINPSCWIEAHMLGVARCFETSGGL